MYVLPLPKEERRSLKIAMPNRIVIAGSVAQRPGLGGHTWQFLQYLLGFKELGWDVLFLDRLDPQMCRNAAGRQASLEDSFNLAYFLGVMKRFDLTEQFSLNYNHGEKYIGKSAREVIEKTKAADFLVNVMGFLDDNDVLSAANKRVFLDTDPGFSQMWRELGLADLFRGHDKYVTIAENIGQSDCAIPTCGLDWITWRQPVLLNQWPVVQATNGAFTSIGSWRGPYAPVEYRGTSYGLRVHEFRKFAALPIDTSEKFEVALDIDAVEVRDIDLLTRNGWQICNPKEATATPESYRNYVQNSKAEFMATKTMYVATHSGWFSERSICYLSSGKPVLAQDTGFSRNYPTGTGLIAFSTMEEARNGVAEIAADYEKHCRAARDIAEEYFDSDKVLAQLIEKLA
jgi:hypothetical protein